jgi:glycosyltransferase involved in cell wall biosynthesis
MSWDEGFGLPSLEAMACGAAVVTYDNGGSRDFAFDGKTAFVAPRRNLEILAAKLEEAITSHEKRHTIAKAGYSFVHTMPTWEEQVTKMEQILLQDND